MGMGVYRKAFMTNTIRTVNIFQTIMDADCIKVAVIITTDKIYENKEFDISFKEI